MRQFLKLIETARTFGITGAHPSIPNKTVHFSVAADTKIIDWLSKCQPIVFATGEMIVDADEVGEQTWGPSEEKIDAPFAHFSIEKLDGALLLSKETSYSDEFSLLCVAVKEIAPRQFIFLSLIERSKDKTLSVCATNSEAGLVKRFVEILNTQKTGIAQVRQSIKLGSGKNKRHHRIMQVVYVSPKRDQAKVESAARNVVWTHRWLVRGHWRNVPGRLGKDRTGVYCVKDLTWVTEFEKGPEGAPLVSKTRFVGGNEGGNNEQN